MMGNDTDICFVAPYAYRYLGPENSDPAGGAQRQQYMLATELSDRGYNVAFIVEDVGQPNKQIIEGMFVSTGCPIDIESPISIPKATCRLWASMRQVDADYYYVRGAPRLAVVTSLGASLLRKNFLFCIANDTDINQSDLKDRYPSPIRWMYIRAIRSTDTVIAQTKNQQAQLSDVYDIESIQIPNGYDLPPNDQILSPESREFVLWVGSSDPMQKRPELFLNLAERLPEMEFIMVSKPMPDGGEYHKQLSNQAKNISNLRFIGGVDPDDIHDYYRRALLVVNTSSHEGFPNTFLEAWRFATPVVSLSFDLDGRLQAEEIGVYSGSLKQLVSDIRSLVADPTQRASIGQNGRELVRTEFSLSSMTDRYEDVIQRNSR